MDAFLRSIMEGNFCLLWDKMEITRFMSLLMPLWMWRIKITVNGFWNYYIKILEIMSIMDGTSSQTCKRQGLIPAMQEVMPGSVAPRRYGLRGPIPSADRPKNTPMRGPAPAHPTPAYDQFDI
ncbi:hypothetical protein MTR_7g025355 [Medicago truncatula]|uniref:Uncharacterized protein n=1 Tax=Medicago truncatula TaxID=3880 RepID=A0A072TWX2_MEDTR|nr:hypothetical protein MTR_7g025355 [Medicago truncatula]